jgi:hypothetical protein
MRATWASVDLKRSKTMRSRSLIAVATLAMWAGATQIADAQYVLGQVPPRVRPTVSPAINIANGGAYSYYGYIKPQTEATRAIMSLQQTVGQLNTDGSIAGQLDPYRQQTNALGGIQTGHPATYFYTGGYFPVTLPGGGAGLGGAGSYGVGLGGFGPGMGMAGYGVGAGATGSRVFFPATMTQGIRP